MSGETELVQYLTDQPPESLLNQRFITFSCPLRRASRQLGCSGRLRGRRPSSTDRDAAFSVPAPLYLEFSLRLGLDVITKYLLCPTVKSENILAIPLA
jgi:hypothetical protein